MYLRIWTFFIIFLFLSLNHLESQNLMPDQQWPSYRGYFASGVLDNSNLPDTWNVEKSENVKWKIEIPGLGVSCPVIWGDKLFITTAISDSDTSGLRTGIFGDGKPVDDNSEHDFNIYCLNKQTGKLLWQRTSYTGVPKVKRHPKATHSNCTPATNGKYVVSFFASEGLYCYDMDGKLKWKKDFGKLDAGAFNAKWAEWEFGSSPIIYKDVVIVQCDVRGDSFVAAFEIATGKEKWKKMRDEYPCWSTPNIYTYEDRESVVVNGYKHRGAYDFITGEEIWKMSGGGDVPIPTPIMGHNMIYFNSAHGKSSPILAIKTSAKGDITLKKDETSNNYVKWSIPRGAGYMQTMLIYDDYLYNLKWNGNLTCYNAKTGEEIYKETLKMGMSFTACPVASDGKIYITDDEGMVYIVQAGKEFKLLSKNPIGDICMTTPAITDNIIYFRTMKYLIAISKN